MALSSVKFSGHQSFPVRNTWLTKGVIECDKDANVFRREDAMAIFGVGKNMVDSIKYWTVATCVLDNKLGPGRGYDLKPSELGQRIFLQNGGWDRYLEDIGTLWLLHTLLVTNPIWATTAYYVFNELPGSEFTRADLEVAIIKLSEQNERRPTSHNTLHRDVGVFIQTYAGSSRGNHKSVEDYLDCPFTELGLIYEEPSSHLYAFSRGPKPDLPDEVFVFALNRYADGKSDQSTFTFDELAYQPNSPGRIFKLDESALAERLERLTEITSDRWHLTETAGYRQVTMTDSVNTYALLDQYYARRLGVDVL